MKTQNTELPVVQQQQPKCVAIAEAGVRNSQQMMRYLSALIADGSAGRVTTGMMHGACNAVGKLLRVAEMEARYGTAGANQERVLEFIGEDDAGTRHYAPAGHPTARESALSKLTPEERAALGL